MSLTLWYEIACTVITVVAAALFAVSPLAKYDLQVIAALFITFIFLRKKLRETLFFTMFEAMMFIFIIVSMVFSTGGLHSSFFFLLYFLMFALALLLDSITSLVVAVTLIVIFLGAADYSFALKDALPIFSLPFIAPFAKYLGDLRKKYANQQEKIKELARAREKVVAREEGERAETLLFLTTMLHRHFYDISERLTNFQGDHDLSYLRDKMRELKKLVSKFKEY
ncbi:MAG: hypothetical protein AAB893_00380, partial [Patescibacteria group bacterium]